jgi:hypothetical protein
LSSTAAKTSEIYTNKFLKMVDLAHELCSTGSIGYPVDCDGFPVFALRNDSECLCQKEKSGSPLTVSG